MWPAYGPHWLRFVGRVDWVKVYVRRARNARHKEIVIGHQKDTIFPLKSWVRCCRPVRQCAAATSPVTQPSYYTFQDGWLCHCMMSHTNICSDSKTSHERKRQTNKEIPTSTCLSYFIYLSIYCSFFQSCFFLFCLFACLSLSVGLSPTYLPTYLPIYLSIDLRLPESKSAWVDQSPSKSIHLHLSLSLCKYCYRYLSLYISISLSFYLYSGLSLCHSARLPFCPSPSS
jgi:hypothetical protein